MKIIKKLNAKAFAQMDNILIIIVQIIILKIHLVFLYALIIILLIKLHILIKYFVCHLVKN